MVRQAMTACGSTTPLTAGATYMNCEASHDTLATTSRFIGGTGPLRIVRIVASNFSADSLLLSGTICKRQQGCCFYVPMIRSRRGLRNGPTKFVTMSMWSQISGIGPFLWIFDNTPEARYVHRDYPCQLCKMFPCRDR